MVLAATFLGRWSCTWAIDHFKRGDPSQVVIDEVAGVWLSVAILVFIPWVSSRTARLQQLPLLFAGSAVLILGSLGLFRGLKKFRVAGGLWQMIWLQAFQLLQCRVLRSG